METLNNFEFGPLIFYILATVGLIWILWKHRPAQTGNRKRMTPYLRTGLIYPPAKTQPERLLPSNPMDGAIWLRNIWFGGCIFYWIGRVVGLLETGNPAQICFGVLPMLAMLAFFFVKWDRKNLK